MLAAKEGKIETVRELLEAGADVNAHNEFGVTALKLAVLDDNLQIVRELIRAEADVNFQGEMGSALMCASGNDFLRPRRMNRLSIAEELIRAGADVNARGEDGASALVLAIFNNELETARMLIEHGADLNAKTEDGETVLEFAEGWSSPETINQLAEEMTRRKFHPFSYFLFWLKRKTPRGGKYYARFHRARKVPHMLCLRKSSFGKRACERCL